MTMDWNLDHLWLLNIDLVVSRKFWIVNKLSDCLKLLYPRIVENLRISEVLENLQYNIRHQLVFPVERMIIKIDGNMQCNSVQWKYYVQSIDAF